MARRAWKPNSFRWDVAPTFDGSADLARLLHTSPLVAQVLANRGLADADPARGFLPPKLSDLHDPRDLTGCEAAADRIARAVADGEKIVIYGDYDVDGMTATAILHACLRMSGAEVDFYVPHRLEEGYGLNAEAVGKIIADGAKLIVTVDCGVTAGKMLAETAAGKADVIVTDHHTIQDEVPDVAAVVHPQLAGPAGEYGNPHLCGAGVAFKLAWQTARVIHGDTRVDDTMKNFLLDATCLAALGTIADVVPLLGENRVLATHGLRGLPSSQHVGIVALLASAKLSDTKLDAYHVGFVLAPRLNAAGRMGHARLAIELLTTDQPDRAREIADYLAGQNTKRQQVEREITTQAVQMVADRNLDDRRHRAIVLASEDWHGGVIGIVASRLVDRFHRPTIIISLDDNGKGQGSGRSIPGLDMAEALHACSEHVSSYGGHAMAGGIRLARKNVEAFTKAFEKYAKQHVTDEHLTAVLHIEAETAMEALSYNTVQQLERMAPFGQGNRRPVVAIRGCEMIMPPKRMGRSGQTLGLLLGRGDCRMRAVGFGMGDLADQLQYAQNVDIAGEPMLNTYNGQTTVEIRLRDVKWQR